MSGHSKWSQIKHKKALSDGKRGQLFSKLSRLITLAAKRGINPETNLELKNAVENARSFNMPNDSIQRALKRVSDKSAAQLEELTIEAIGPGNTAIRVEAVTDNRNRTIAEIKKILSENNSKMVPPGSISWMFSQSASIKDPEINSQIYKLLETLDGHDDINDVISNLS